MFGCGKFWRIWRIVRALPNFNQPNFSLWYPNGQPIHSPNFYLPNTFNSTICQTLTLPNIPTIRYMLYLHVHVVYGDGIIATTHTCHCVIKAKYHIFEYVYLNTFIRMTYVYTELFNLNSIFFYQA